MLVIIDETSGYFEGRALDRGTILSNEGYTTIAPLCNHLDIVGSHN